MGLVELVARSAWSLSGSSGPALVLGAALSLLQSSGEACQAGHGERVVPVELFALGEPRICTEAAMSSLRRRVWGGTWCSLGSAGPAIGPTFYLLLR